MGDVEALHKEVQRAITEINDRLLKVEGELFAARHGISIVTGCLSAGGIIDRDEWNKQITKIAEHISSEAVDAKDTRTRKMLIAASSAFQTFSVDENSVKGFQPVVIKGGREPD